jgi:aspartyl/asparaginyl beta-hydroxylase (cupin superfamily)
MFYSLTDNWVKLLETNSQEIKTELESYISTVGKENLSKYYSYATSTNGWLTIPIVFFTIINKSTISFFPKTCSIINQIPELITAEFSILEPHTKINAHEGYSKQIMRTHLGLKIPKDDLAIKCNNEIKKWEDGFTLSFNDGYLHEAWNNSNEERWVLMIDTPIPNSIYSAFQISKHKLENLTDNTLLSIGSKEEWMKWFYDSNE